MRVRYFVESAFLEMLREKPVGQVRVADILDSVGICKGTFYKYYCDKYDLLQKCFYNEFYREILERSETFEQFHENSLSVFRKAPKIVLHAMTPEDSDSLYGYHSRLAADFLRRDREREGKQTAGEPYESMISLYADNATLFTVEWLGASRHGQTEETLKLIRAARPIALAD